MTVSSKRAIVLAMLGVTAACSNAETPQDRAVALADVAQSARADTLVVYKSPTCGCCSKWVDHVEEHGFVAVTHDMSEPELARMKQQLGVPAGRISCHTATVGGYTLEGHVPADVIRRLLDEKPAGIRGLAVPGMPMGSPGMESVIRQQYDVLTFDGQGNVAVYESR